MAEAPAQALSIRTGIRLEVVPVVRMAVEGALAIGAGTAARSGLLTAFGADTLVELLSGVTLLGRLRTEAWDGDLERREAVK
jgi:hypothetical protein